MKKTSLVEFNDATPRIVTPDNPLIITESSATFSDVIIEGGDVIMKVQTTITFNRLEKKS